MHWWEFLSWICDCSNLPCAVENGSFGAVTQEEDPSSLYNFLYPSKELLPDDKEMSIFDHLEELRGRIFISVLAVGASILGCFFFSKDIIKILEAPVSVQGVRFLQLSPGEFFFTTLKVNLCKSKHSSLEILLVLFLFFETIDNILGCDGKPLSLSHLSYSNVISNIVLWSYSWSCIVYSPGSLSCTKIPVQHVLSNPNVSQSFAQSAYWHTITSSFLKTEHIKIFTSMVRKLKYRFILSLLRAHFCISTIRMQRYKQSLSICACPIALNLRMAELAHRIS